MLSTLSKTHITGESVFIDDIATLQNEVHVGYVGSPVAHGFLKNIDSTEALKVPGVLAVYTAKDIHHNLWGTIVKDQPILVENEINYFDEPLCIIAAETKAILEIARKKIKFKIINKKPILDIQRAIDEKLFLHSPLPFKSGDVNAAFEQSENKMSGVFEIGGQEHFYLESQASIAYPDDSSQIKIISSSQHPTETQHLVSEALGLPFHHVVCEVKRMGGAFGGKESQAAPFAAMAALVAHKLKRPARIVLSKDDDMAVTGKRHPFKVFYDVAFTNDGIIKGLKLKLYADGGAYTDLSPSILDRAMFHSDGSYFIENTLIEGWVCKTHTASNTAFRGFGGPQGNLIIENIIEDIAHVLKKDAADIRILNCYQKTKNNRTHYGQIVENNLLPDLFSEILKTSDYRKRRTEITEFNENSKYQKKGLSLTACKFGISFTAKFLNQANALVNVHRDGTVQVSTGATEMGQGVNTKIQTVVANAFGIAINDVHVMTTSTEKNANTSPTAASSGSDLNCAAALLACEKILSRLNDIQKEFFKNTKPTWVELVNKAYMERISISDYAHFKTEGLDFDRVKAFGNAFKYFTTGTAVSEVLIDTLTGETKILRADILMDIGQSLNQGIDLGQISGGFVQGMGWMTSEKLFYNQNGKLVSHSPTTYKIPNIQDTPRIFNINILENNLNKDHNVRGTKAVGEPPLLLSASVFMAIKNAMSYTEKYQNRQALHPSGFSCQTVKISVPATPEEILMNL